MPSNYQVLLASMAMLQPSLAAMGGAFSTGPVNDGNFIRQAWSTLIVPDAPSPVEGLLSLWTGMGTSNGDLVQALCKSFAPNGGSNACDNLGGDWCASTYTLQGDFQNQGPQSRLSPGSKVTMYYAFNDATGNYDQWAFVDSEPVSFLSTSSGRALGWGTAEECSVKACGIVPQHNWVGTNIILDQAYPGYIDTMGTNAANQSGFASPDGGKTWRVDTITIFEWNNTYL